VDFAYSVHTDVGHRTVGAKINGTMRALDTHLRNGDTVEILTGKKKRPNPDWLAFVATSRARTKIRHFLRSEERKRSRQVGRQLWEQEAKRFGIDVNRAEKKGDLQRVAQTLRFTGPEEMFSVLGYGKIEPRAVVEKMMSATDFRAKVEELDGEAGETTGVLRKLVRRVTRTRRSSGIQVDGLDDVLVRFAKCCEPVMGEEIVGYVTRGAGVSVHRTDCPQVHEIDPQRRVDVSWEKADRVEPRSVKVRVTSADRPGMLMGMSEAISKCSVNIKEVRARTNEDGQGEAVSDFIVLIRDHAQLSQVIGQLRKVRGVLSVERVSH
jgi:GTP pyrophosphokinase